MTMNRVSVVIPTYNRAQFVREAVESVLQQTIRPDEIIVVDDGSTDDTQETLARFGDTISILRQPNHGKSAARNAGIGAARGEWIAFLDSDDLWHPRRMEVLRTFLQSRPAGVGLVFGNYLPRHGTTTEEWRALEEQELFPVFRRHALRLADALPEAGVLQCANLTVPYRLGSPACHLFFGNFVGMCGAAIRAEALRECGPFREGWDFAEDWELYLRLARRYRFAYLEFPMFIYRYHPGQAIVVAGRVEARSRIAQVVEGNLDIVESMPESMRRKARRRVGRAFRGRALALLRAGRTDGVREDALRSLRYDPRRLDALLYGLAGLVPAGMLRAAVAGLRRRRP
jgi:glycosyltransferase involved in cell wall biosynthesis